MSYIGTEPKDIRSFGRTKFDYTATQGQTAFTGADDDGKVLAFTVGQIEVYVNGILMDDSDFTTTGTGTVTLASAANLNDVVNVVSFETNIPDSNYVPASGGTFTGAVAMSGTLGVTGVTTLSDDLVVDTDTLFVDASTNRVGLGTTTPDTSLDIESATPIIRLKDTDTGSYSEISASSGDGNIFIKADEGNGTAASGIRFHVDGSHVGRFQDEKFFVGKTTSGVTNQGGELRNGASGDYAVLGTSQSQAPFIANRTTSDGEIFRFRKNNTAVGSIGSYLGAYLYIGSTGGSDTHINFVNGNVRPATASGAHLDNDLDLGHTSSRWDDIYATNGTIQTSDENEKQNIASLTSAEITAATAISKLFKTYKWKDKVAAKGDNARTHTGVVAQQVQTAMSDAGLDASKYAFWCSNTWWTKDGNHYDTKDEAPEGATEHTRMGIRYPELLSFIGAATEQRLTSIESRLTALEAG
tara:strand:- start:1141 stop:2550 length:1410 start_codon:yes stop_codon:yes gene_type:complete